MAADCNSSTSSSFLSIPLEDVVIEHVENALDAAQKVSLKRMFGSMLV
jgi:hypothetical protein